MSQRRFYFDYAASTPVDPRVEAAMRPYFLKKFGNAGSLHSFGQEASSAMDSSREIIAKAIGADFREIIFTGSATEANNLALRGVVKGHGMQGRGYKPRIIVSSIEHESVLETCKDLERDGVEIIYLPVNREGLVDIERLRAALNANTILVSIMHANNEIGTIQPISEIAEIVRDFRKKSEARSEKSGNQKPLSLISRTSYPLFHTDAVQALQFLDCNADDLGIDMMTFSAHKIYGPKGIGVLYIRNPKPETYNPKPILTGGGQEFGFRSGTENIPLIVGFAKAVELAAASRSSEFRRIKKLKDYFWHGILEIHPRAELNGPDWGKNSQLTCLPNIFNVYFPDYEAQYLLAKFDLTGIAVSAGSACSARSAQQSYVITALGFPEKRARQSIRFSFGRPTTRKDIDSALKVIRKLL